jgi:outer membrane protein TolC
MKNLAMCLFLLFSTVHSFAQQNQVDELFQLALTHNLNLKNNTLQKELADITSKIAGLNAFAPRIPVSYQALDNIALQRMYVPGVLFGQPEGTFKELTMGQKYVATFNISPQFDILNFGNKAQRKAATLNEASVALNEKSVQRDIYLQINSAYHNILSFQRQRTVLEENLKVAKKIKEVITNRQEEGLARKQEVNEAEVNIITLEDKIYQVDQNVVLQYELLKVLTGTQNLPDIASEVHFSSNHIIRAESDLDSELAEMKSKVASQDVFSARRDQWPVLSAISSFNWQNLNNSFFYGAGSNAIHYSFIGLKLSWDLPTNVQKISNLKNKEIQFKMAENAQKQAAEQQAFSNTQREIELSKAKGQWESLKKIEQLRKDTFGKNFAQFEEEILSLDKLLISQNDLLVSQLNLASGAVNVNYNFEVIRINNLY